MPDHPRGGHETAAAEIGVTETDQDAHVPKPPVAAVLASVEQWKVPGAAQRDSFGVRNDGTAADDDVDDARDAGCGG